MRKVIAIAGIAGLSLVWAAVPAGAGNNPNFVSSPTKGPPGTVIHASDHNFGCDNPGATVRVDLVDQNEHTVVEVQTHVTNDSIWDADLTVPAGTPAGGYVITVDCMDGEFSVFYSNNEFVVTEAAATTTTTSTTIAPAAVTTTTTVPPAPVVPAATPAAPVVAAPALTG